MAWESGENSGFEKIHDLAAGSHAFPITTSGDTIKYALWVTRNWWEIEVQSDTIDLSAPKPAVPTVLTPIVVIVK